jgi:hypothetical protein
LWSSGVLRFSGLHTTNFRKTCQSNCGMWVVVPVKPLFELSQENEFSMFKGYGVYDWVLPIYRYRDVSDLLSNLQEQVIEPARHKALIWTEKKLQIEQGKLL